MILTRRSSLIDRLPHTQDANGITSMMNIDQPFVQYMTDAYDGTGNRNMATTASDWGIRPPEGYRYEIHRLLIQIVDGAAFATDTYGAIPALTSGINIFLRDIDDSLVTVLSGAQSIKTNEDWARLCYDTAYENYGGGGADRVLNIRWSLDKFGGPLILKFGQTLQVNIPDDLSALTYQYVVAQGKKVGGG